jgi:hypothetical protein
MKLSELAREVTRLADATREYWDRELPKRHPNYPFVNPGEDSGPPPPEEEQLHALLESLPADQLHQLALLAQLGSAELSVENLVADPQMSLREIAQDSREALVWMLGNPSIGDDLTDGLESLKKHALDPDRLHVQFAEAQRQPAI